MSKTPYLPGKIFISFSQIGKLMKLYDNWDSNFDPSRSIKVLYTHPDFPEPMPLHIAFYNFAKRMIDKAEVQAPKLEEAS